MTTWIERFTDALYLLCGSMPPERLVREWVSNTADPRGMTLQDWAATQSKLWWSMGISVIEAAEHLADHPEEGKGHAARETEPIHQNAD